MTALTRSPARARLPNPPTGPGRPTAPDQQPSIHWRHCDLFSITDLTAALTGIDYAIWLVHSLAPSSRLTQASPRDLDLVLADNFAAAAAANGVRQIIMVSSVQPEGYRISPMLWSRREVELVLAARGTPVTALRASLVVGPGGTGPALLVDLVRRLPVLIVPPAARSLTRPIALGDLVQAIRYCLGRPQEFQGAFDIGGADCLSYQAMLRETAAVLGRRRWLLTLPGLPTGLAALIARAVSRAPGPMVAAIVESLPQDTRMHDNPVQQAIAPTALGFRAALTLAIDPATGRLRPNPRTRSRDSDRELMRAQSLVRSIQRVILPPGEDAAWIAGNYFRWLGECCWPLVRTRIDATGAVTVMLRWPRLTLLVLRPDHALGNAGRQVYRITGGLLARPNRADSNPTGSNPTDPTPGAQPRFEFQTLLAGRYVMTAIHDYAPALPWWLYLPTQAFAHLRVMRRYQRRLARSGRAG